MYKGLVGGGRRIGELGVRRFGSGGRRGSFEGVEGEGLRRRRRRVSFLLSDGRESGRRERNGVVEHR